MSRASHFLTCYSALSILGATALSAQTPISKAAPKTSAPAPRIASIGGSPTTTTLTVIGAAATARLLRFEVSRWNQAAPNCCRNSAVITANQGSEGRWVDHDFPLSGIYVYSITSVYDDGTRGTLQIDYTRPEPVNPDSLAVGQTGYDAVQLTWPEVPQATSYQVWGAGIASSGMTVSNAALPPGSVTLVPGVSQQLIGNVRHFVLTLTGVPVGAQRYSVGSFYEPPSCTSVPAGQPCQKVSTIGTAFTQGSVTVVALRKPPEN